MIVKRLQSKNRTGLKDTKMHLYGRNGSKTDTIFVHLRCGGIYSDSVINFSPILTVEEF